MLVHREILPEKNNQPISIFKNSKLHGYLSITKQKCFQTNSFFFRSFNANTDQIMKQITRTNELSKINNKTSSSIQSISFR